ncbi:hypothetical protein GLE_3340 [Lysobacter enzymogenes]|uniref:Uncharacterized protein n=1 Tax=Lysobacter enzymogenes TaxID=69 RepID=A0A0S2DJI2_LYSEN|nr:hypothetical protein GLE_3340 [Lysobacter enzymogenes]
MKCEVAPGRIASLRFACERMQGRSARLSYRLSARRMMAR